MRNIRLWTVKRRWTLIEKRNGLQRGHAFADPLSGAAFRDAADHPAESLFGPRTPVAFPVSESEAEPESDSFPQPPTDYESPKLFQRCATPVDQSKVFGFGCTPAGAYEGHHYKTRPVWWSEMWDKANGSRNGPDCAGRAVLETGLCQAVLPAKDQRAMQDIH
jgi:hypothetical protein